MKEKREDPTLALEGRIGVDQVLQESEDRFELFLLQVADEEAAQKTLCCVGTVMEAPATGAARPDCRGRMASTTFTW